jgi:hypothetical protein
MGLVASAFGLLHCREAVQSLVAHRASGPWAGRLQAPRDLAVMMGSASEANRAVCAPDAQLGTPPAHADLQPCFAREDSVVTATGEAAMESMLRALQPHGTHRGRAALILRCVRMPESISSWAKTLQEEMCTAQRGALASAASANANMSALVDMQRGTCEFLRSAGSALAQRARPFNVHDFARAMYRCNALAVELAG